MEGRGESWELEVLSVEEKSNLVVQTGISRLTVKKNDSATTFITKFLLLWELEEGGYKISMDFYQQYQ